MRHTTQYKMEFSVVFFVVHTHKHLRKKLTHHSQKSVHIFIESDKKKKKIWIKVKKNNIVYLQNTNTPALFTVQSSAQQSTNMVQTWKYQKFHNKY